MIIAFKDVIDIGVCVFVVCVGMGFLIRDMPFIHIKHRKKCISINVGLNLAEIDSVCLRQGTSHK